MRESELDGENTGNSPTDGEIWNLGEAFDGEQDRIPEAVNITAVEDQVSTFFKGYVEELLSQSEAPADMVEPRPGASSHHAQVVDDLMRSDLLLAKMSTLQEYGYLSDGDPVDEHNNPDPVPSKTNTTSHQRQKVPMTKAAKDAKVGDAKQKPDAKKKPDAKQKPKRATSNLRKLQNKLSQQRFRQRKRHAEAAQQSELDRMLSKIGSLETAKTELPKLQSENVILQSALDSKDMEIAQLKKEIALAKKKKIRK